MIKNWKSLFVKGEENEAEQPADSKNESPSFPVYNPSTASTQSASGSSALSAEVNEVMAVYEKGLDSINMPGYDFYEFYKAVQMALPYNEQTFNMAFQMAKAMDSGITVQKLVNDAEFYISKINDVHNTYVTQGQGKLSQISDKKVAEKIDLNKQIDAATMRIAQLRTELAQLESEVQKNREKLNLVDQEYAPVEQEIKSKLNANDLAKSNSVTKLNLVKDNIQKFIKS